MTDAARRLTERAAALGDREAEARAITMHLRAGGRDPRESPVVGDRVAARPGKRPVHYADTGAWSGPRRGVDSLWPKILGRRLVVRPFWTGAGLPSLRDLRDGALVLACTVYERASQMNDLPFTWRLSAKDESQGLMEWTEFVAYSEPEIAGTDRGGLPLEVVEWHHDGAFGSRRSQRSTLAAWRRWARGGTVLRLGDR